MKFVARIEGGSLGVLATRLRGFENLSGLAGLLNTAGEMVRAATVAAETKQTNLPGDTLERAQKVIPASAGNLRFTIWSHGGNVRLKYFHAREYGTGVAADPWGSSRFYPRAFITSGRSPRRAPAPKLNGQVYTQVSGYSTRWGGKTAAAKGGLRGGPITQARSGLFIPTEMTRGATAGAFGAGTTEALRLLESRLMALLG